MDAKIIDELIENLPHTSHMRGKWVLVGSGNPLLKMSDMMAGSPEKLMTKLTDAGIVRFIPSNMEA